MDHLPESVFLELIEGRGSPADEEHLCSCRHCRAELAEWQALLEDLNDAGSETMEESELHRLGIMFRAFGPLREGCRELLASLLEPPALSATAVRGRSAAPVEHEAGPYHVTMQVRPGLPRGGITVHGQVYCDDRCDDRCDGADLLAGEVVLSNDGGFLRLAEIDELGEFSVPLPDGGSFRATLLLPSSRIVIEHLEIPSRQ